MAIVILPRNTPISASKLEKFPLDDCRWVFGSPNRERTVGDLSEDSHVIVRCSSKTFFLAHRKLRCKVSLMVKEPPAIQGRYYFLLRLFGRQFHRVFTHNNGLLTALPNARFMAHGGCRVEPPYHKDHKKTERISIVASRKKKTVGHRLRHRIAEWTIENAPDLVLLGRGYKEIHNKVEAHSAFMFSAVIENSRSPGYFTEKLVESFLCMCLPIYWGAPDICHFFDHRGMIICNTEDELKKAIRNVTEKDYEIRQKYLEENFERALKYIDMFIYAATVLSENDRLNNYNA